MNRFRSKLRLIALILLSCLLAPLVHTVIKPYRMRVEVVLRHQNPTQLDAYFSTSRSNPKYIREQDTSPFVDREGGGPAPNLSTLVAFIASRKPITQLRFDPSTNANTVTVSAISIHTLLDEADLPLSELLDLAKKGSGIVDPQVIGNEMRFGTVGDDAHFFIPIPASIGVPSSAEVKAWYLVAWVIAISLLLLLKISIFTPHPVFNNNGARPFRLGKIVFYIPVISERVFNLVGLAVLGYTLIRFIGLTVGMDFSHVKKSFEHDRISIAIPNEVLQIRSILQRHPIPAFELAGDMGQGEDESTIYQRATEFLYPVRVVAHSNWIMARASFDPMAARADCKLRDQQGEIVLYECAK